MRKGAEIPLADSSEVELWCAALGVSRAELVAAVSTVGNRSANVVLYLLDNGAIKRRALADALERLRENAISIASNE